MAAESAAKLKSTYREKAAFNREVTRAIVLILPCPFLSTKSNIKIPSMGKNVSMVKIQLSNISSP